MTQMPQTSQAPQTPEKSAQTITLRRLLPASCEEVFDAWLDADGMRQWMCPGPVTSCEATLDPRPGGRFRFIMKAPGAEFISTGEFRALDRPSRLQFSWISSRWENQETLVTIELQPRDTHCELVLIHERFPAGLSTEQVRGGWTAILEKLGRHLDQPPALRSISA
jgi:uncharacterized protein YndB with AHSA1/START domain